MKGLLAAAFAIAIALPACGQRGGSGNGGHASVGAHGALAARPAPGFHGNFAPSGPYNYSGGVVAHGPVAYPSSMRMIAPGVRYPVTAPVIRPGFYHPPHGPTTTHNFYVHTYPIYPYTYPSYVFGYLPPDLLDNSYDNGDASQQPQTEPQPDYGSAYPQQAPDSGYPQQLAPQPGYGYASPQPAPAYPGYPQPQPAPEGAYAYPAPVPQPAPAAPQMQYVPGSATTVILIYKDGRPPEQIQNYLATRTTLTVLDGNRRRDIPLSDLNIPATVNANRQTGVDFQLPTATP